MTTTRVTVDKTAKISQIASKSCVIVAKTAKIASKSTSANCPLRGPRQPGFWSQKVESFLVCLESNMVPILLG